eukprot:TRINITY_DN34860_c0_g1_i1.p1 TRINITY_DN34860_c0_g1~~TRINITY_DN34860_c0_g1_i1.p1  ORF type:complete len:833 (-),score=157.51 TRINITY_DN34860_c0_g1_i1:380-2644(-)
MSIRVMDRFKPLELGNLAYAYGRLQLKHEQLLSSLQDEIIYRGTIGKSLQNVGDLYRFGLRSLEQITQAFSRLGVKDQRLYFVLFDMTRQRVREFARRMKKEDEASDALQPAIDASRVARLASRGEDPDVLTGHGLAVLLSAFARSKADFHTLVRWAPQQVNALQGQCTTFELARIFSACSRLGISSPSMYAELLGHAKPRIPQMSPKAISVLIRAMARAKMYNRVLMRQAVKVVSPRLAELSVVDVGALLVGCSELNYRDERFLRLLATVVLTRMDEMSGSQLATALATYAQMRIRHQKWFDAILFELFRRQHELGEKDATNVAFAMLLLSTVECHEGLSETDTKASEILSDATIPYPFDRHQGILYSMLGVTNEHRRNLSYPAVYQLQIVELYLRLMAPQVYNEMRQELKSTLEKARGVSVLVDDYMQNSSKMHRRISQWFTRVGLHHRSEVFLGPFMLDMVIGDKVVVEIDGPTHFYRDTNSRTASSLLKDSLLTAMGFHVKHLPYQEWQQCGTAVKRTLYCSTFWRDVIAAEGLSTADASSASGKSPPRFPQLVDILELVVNWQAGQGPHPSAALSTATQSPGETVVKPENATSIPAFYLDEEPVGRATDEFDMQHQGEGFDLDKERAGARSPEELLAAHKQAEQDLEEDRRREISAAQRWRLDRRNELPLSDSEDFNAGLSSELDSKAELRMLLPRSKRQLITHNSSAGLFDYDALEADTDMSSDEEAGAEAEAEQPKLSKRKLLPRPD